MKRSIPVPAVLAIGILAAAHGADTSEEPTRLPEFFVPGQRIAGLELAVPRSDLRPPEPNLGQALLAIPGVYGQSRAADAVEPSIRGLGLDRVATTIDGVPLVNASPERTNSPVVILGPAAVASIHVAKALPSVTLGPATTGGQISLSTTPESTLASAPPFEGRLNMTYHGARDGFTTDGRLAARSGEWDAGVTFFRNSLGDYTAADGRQVAARLDDCGASAALGFHSAHHRALLEVLQRRLRLQETVSLPLDGKNTSSQVVTFSDHWTPDSGQLKSLEWRAGGSFTDPYITSEDRRSAPPTFAQATARSFGAGLNSIWRLGKDDRLSLGSDYTHQRRRAVRTTTAGRDYIWPDAIYDDTGIFAEWNRVLPAGWRLRLGARVDEVTSDARDVDKPALGRPIRDQFVTYDGPAAASTARRDTVGAVNALGEWKPSATMSAFVGAGFGVQPAEVMERYRAFLNALGGDGRGGNAVELGNPALKSERKWAIETGGIWRGAWVDMEATAYAYRILDFILREPIGTTQPPLARMVVFGYRNIDADLYGGELGATFKYGTQWTAPMTFSVAEGKNRETGVGLSEIPPWEATAAVRYHGPIARQSVAVEFGGRIVGGKSNPAPLENPLFGHAGGFALWHGRVGLPLGRNFKIEAGIENLFDHRYTEYLSPPVAPFRPASGDLMPGDRVPAPGRSTWISVTFLW